MSWGLLVVEDDADIREELANIFAARGYRAYAAGNGREALVLTESAGMRPALILLDLAMPEMDGMEFLARQATTPLLADVPVVVMTAFPTAGRKFPDNVKAVLEKPLALRRLLEVIQDVLNAPAARH